jgi:hypothetical protein
VGRRKLSKLTSRRYTFSGWGVFYVLTVFRKLEGKLATLQEDLTGSKQECNNQQSEQMRIRYLSSSNPPCTSIHHCPTAVLRLRRTKNLRMSINVYSKRALTGMNLSARRISRKPSPACSIFSQVRVASKSNCHPTDLIYHAHKHRRSWARD